MAASLRIGMVSHYMPPHFGGIETVTDTLFHAYRAGGCEVRWIASRIPKTSAACEDGRIRVGCWNMLERALSIPWPVWGPGGVAELVKLVRWADILHVHDCLYLGSILTVLLARRTRRPVLLSQHNGFVHYRSPVLTAIQRFAYWSVGRAVLRRATRVALCNPTAERFVTALLRGRPAFAGTIPLGVDTVRFRPADRDERNEARRILRVPESGTVVLFVGRLVAKKGIDLFLEVSRRMPWLHFLVVGRGTLPSQPAGNLTWLAAVPAERMPLAYQAADAFLLPSRDEGVPLSVLEAMSAGVPVILSEGHGSRVALEREGGCLLAKDEPEALCGRLGHLLETPDLASRMAARSRELAVRDRSLEAMQRRYLETIHELAAGVRAGPAVGRHESR